ncbi:MAG: glycosyltransferase family 4 protein [Patescibacteria group bacterium]|nr:glycosyltransferase family 4 protein [Patescibacteria group bacterium]
MFWRGRIYPRLAAGNQADVNHILDHSYGHLLNFLDPKRSVVTCHDLMPLIYEKNESLRREFESVVGNIKKAAKVIADSVDTQNDLIKYLSVPEDKITVVYLGVDPVFRPFSFKEKTAARKKFGLPEGKIIFSHGRADLPWKNTEGIIRAFSEVAKAVPGAYLLKVNSLTSEQTALLKQLGLSERYLEIDNPSDKDLAGLYNLADVFLSPSFKEGFGLTVLEAMACGLPQVVSRGTSLEEITGDLGIYVDPANIGQIAETVLGVIDGRINVPPQEALTAQAGKFSWEKTANGTMEIYKKVFASLKII